MSEKDERQRRGTNRDKMHTNEFGQFIRQDGTFDEKGIAAYRKKYGLRVEYDSVTGIEAYRKLMEMSATTLHRALSFYEQLPDGQYDKEVSEVLKLVLDMQDMPMIY